MAIIRSVVRADNREPGKAGIVIGEHIFDDDVIWPAVFECLAGQDAMQRLAAMIPQREADRAADDARQALNETDGRARTKVQTYIKSRTDTQLRNIGLTDAEIAVIRAWA